jgi:transposase-like protein
MVDRSTVYSWVQRFLPLFAEAARSHRVPVGGKWRVDETYSAASTADGPTAIERSIRRAK